MSPQKIEGAGAVSSIQAKKRVVFMNGNPAFFQNPVNMPEGFIGATDMFKHINCTLYRNNRMALLNGQYHRW